MKATGAAMMSGQGVATTSTSANREASPLSHHAPPAMANETRVKGTAIRSASRTKGARDFWASLTRSMMRWYCDSAAEAVARMWMAREPLTAPDISASPRVCSTGRDSPVSDDSSKAADVERRTESTGTSSPGLTSSSLPGPTSPTGTSVVWPREPPAGSRCAVSGTRLSRAESSRSARPAAMVSRTSPVLIISTMTREAQYSWTATVAAIAVTARMSTP